MKLAKIGLFLPILVLLSFVISCNVDVMIPLDLEKEIEFKLEAKQIDKAKEELEKNVTDLGLDGEQEAAILDYLDNPPNDGACPDNFPEIEGDIDIEEGVSIDFEKEEGLDEDTKKKLKEHKGHLESLKIRELAYTLKAEDVPFEVPGFQFYVADYAEKIEDIAEADWDLIATFPAATPGTQVEAILESEAQLKKFSDKLLSLAFSIKVKAVGKLKMDKDNCKVIEAQLIKAALKIGVTIVAKPVS